MGKTKSLEQGTFIVVFVAPDDERTPNLYRTECERRGAPFHFVNGGRGIEGRPPRVPQDSLPVMVIADELPHLRQWYHEADQLPYELVVAPPVGQVSSRGGVVDVPAAFDLALQASLTA